MKKMKLSLNKETISRLTDDEAKLIKGAMATDTVWLTYQITINVCPKPSDACHSVNETTCKCNYSVHLNKSCHC
jgi:hypothetical protein